jgi:hypothetical protein
MPRHRRIALTGRIRAPGADAIDTLLMAVFLFGIGTGIAMKFAMGIPIPAVIAGAVGLVLLVKNSDGIGEGQVQALFGVIVVYVVSILCAGGTEFLLERVKGLIQLTYSLIIAFAFYLTALRYDRRALARIFLIACVLILAGCVLENYTSFRAVSDAFRHRFYDFGVYKADLRDMMLYGRVRPKLSTSEPSALTFAYALFAFAWYVLAVQRTKFFAFAALLAAGYVLMRGPTLMLGLPLAGVYELLLAPRRPAVYATGISGTRVFVGLAACVVLTVAFGAVADSLFAARLARIGVGADPSFFSREIGPVKIAGDVLRNHPIAGIGLTGEEFIAERVRAIYMGSRAFSGNFVLADTSHVITNYFWSHWIYLGAVFGTFTLIALSIWLRTVRVPSLAFCWIVWLLFGQASGAYVSPKTWVVLLLAAAVSILHERQPVVAVVQARPASPRAWRGLRPIGVAGPGVHR